ncbi:MAG: hypothetical protein AAGG68_27370 [Bacteroidota bacterium]
MPNTFYEKQKFSAPFFNGIYYGTVLIILLVAAQENIWIATGVGFFALGSYFLLTQLLFLEIKLDEKGIRYRLNPFHSKMRLMEWDIIDSYRTISLNALEFGGYGIRKTLKKTAYIVRSGAGLQVELNSGKVIVFSIKNRTTLDAFLSDLKY